MSTRHIRKLAEKLQLAKLQKAEDTEDTKDDSFEPLYVKKHASAFKELEMSSSSSEPDIPISEYKNSSSDYSDEAPDAAQKQKKKKNNRKKRNMKQRQNANKQSEEDDVEKVIAEVNQLLGQPEAPEADPQPAPKAGLALLKINHKHLNFNNELTRVFGPDENERNSKRRPNLRLQRRQIILTEEVYNFTVKGLNMTLIEISHGVKYFKFEHGPEYQKNMQTLVKVMKQHYDNGSRPHIYPSNTVEALIQNSDLYFKLDEGSTAVNTLEQVIFFMQSVFDTSFNYLDGNTRLQYCHVENRAFHIAVLKYLHILTNRACHRTALELAKLLLNLDPSDPLGLIFIIDTLALRAREHLWMVDVYAHWVAEKDALRLFHFQYSYALAKYHLYLKSKDLEDLQGANALMKHALVKYPNVAVMIMKLCKHENAEIINHEMFTTLANSTTSTDLLSLQNLYANFVWPKWREGNIMNWVITNALEIIAQYKNDPIIKQNVKKAADERYRLFRKYPIEIQRYLCSISSMSNLLVDGSVPDVEDTLSFNPYPDQGTCVDVHRYYQDWGVHYPETTNIPFTLLEHGIIHSFIASLVPDSLPSPRGNNEE